MTFYPDLGTETMCLSGEGVRAVGWLHRDQVHPSGEVPLEFVRRLKEFAVRWRLSTKELWWGIFRGGHVCEFCDRAYGHGNFGVLANNLLYTAPEMIVHYIEDHGYAPPREFIAAVLAAPLPGTQEDRNAGESFRLLKSKQRAEWREEYDGWRCQHPQFPGVAVCLDAWRNWKGLWGGEIVGWELYANAERCARDLIEAFRLDERPERALLSVLADARVAEARPLLESLVSSPDAYLARCAHQGLRMLGIPEQGVGPWEPEILGTWEFQGRPINPPGHGVPAYFRKEFSPGRDRVKAARRASELRGTNPPPTRWDATDFFSATTIISSIKRGISGLCELPTTQATPFSAASSSGARWA